MSTYPLASVTPYGSQLLEYGDDYFVDTDLATFEKVAELMLDVHGLSPVETLVDRSRNWVMALYRPVTSIEDPSRLTPFYLVPNGNDLTTIKRAVYGDALMEPMDVGEWLATNFPVAWERAIQTGTVVRDVATSAGNIGLKLGLGALALLLAFKLLDRK